MLTPPPDVDGDEAFERSFDFSEFPNLQEVDLRVSWAGGNLLWIPTALSTLKPATSPYLSVIKFNFNPLSTADWTAIGDAGRDLRRTVDEFTRIEREFEGAVNVTVLLDPRFEVLDAFNVRFHLCGVADTSDPVHSFSFISRRSFGVEIVEIGSAGASLICLS